MSAALPALRSPGALQGPPGGLDVLRPEDLGVEDLHPQVVEEVGIGLVGEMRLLVIREEGTADRFSVVDEVEHEGARLVGREDAVQPRKGLHRLHVVEPLVDVHGVKQRLVEPGLVLLGDQQDAELGLGELSRKGLLGQRLAVDRVHLRLGVFDAELVAHGA